MTDEPRPYHERVTELSAELAERGSVGLVVLDASPLASIEDEYGSDAYDEVRRRTFKILAEQRGKDYRMEDILALDKPRGHHFIIYLERKRRKNLPTTSSLIPQHGADLPANFIAPAGVSSSFFFGPALALTRFSPMHFPDLRRGDAGELRDWQRLPG